MTYVDHRQCSNQADRFSEPPIRPKNRAQTQTMALLITQPCPEQTESTQTKPRHMESAQTRPTHRQNLHKQGQDTK